MSAAATPGHSQENATTLPASLELFLRIRPERISWLRFLLEGYNGLAVLTTLSAQDGLVRLRLFECGFTETMRLLEAIAGELCQESKAPL